MFDSPPSPPIVGSGRALGPLADLLSIGSTGPRLVLPAAINLGAVALVAPVLNALLARSADPEAAITGYAVAAGLVALIAIPQLRIQQLTLVFSGSRRAQIKVRRFVLKLALTCFVLALLAAVTPIGTWLLVGIYDLSAGPLLQAQAALPALALWAPLACFRTHFYGLMLNAGRAGMMWVGIVGSLLLAGLLAGLLLGSGYVEPAAAAAAGHALAIGVECLYLALVDRRRAHWPDGKTVGPRQLELVKFFAPLLVAALLPSVTIPILHAAMSRFSDGAAGIAAFTLARSVGLLVSVPLWGLQPTVLALYKAGKNRRGVAMFAYAVGLLVLFANLLVANVAPLTDLVLGRLLGAGGELFEQARIAFLIFAFLPPLLAVEQVYSAALLARRRANPFILINMLRLGGLAISVLLALLFAPAAIWVGVAGECGGLATESGATYAIGRRSYRELAGRRA